MPLINPDKLDRQLDNSHRLMGLDLGSRTIGISLSDKTRKIASALETIRGKKFTIVSDRLLHLYDTHEVGALVIGFPINMNGSEGPRCKATRQFVTNLLKKRDLPIIFQDERLSSAAVERMLIVEMDSSRKKRSKLIDKLAATYILQTFLDSHNSKKLSNKNFELNLAST